MSVSPPAPFEWKLFKIGWNRAKGIRKDGYVFQVWGFNPAPPTSPVVKWRLQTKFLVIQCSGLAFPVCLLLYMPFHTPMKPCGLGKEAILGNRQWLPKTRFGKLWKRTLPRYTSGGLFLARAFKGRAFFLSLKCRHWNEGDLQLLWVLLLATYVTSLARFYYITDFDIRIHSNGQFR